MSLCRGCHQKVKKPKIPCGCDVGFHEKCLRQFLKENEHCNICDQKIKFKIHSEILPYFKIKKNIIPIMKIIGMTTIFILINIMISGVWYNSSPKFETCIEELEIGQSLISFLANKEIRVPHRSGIEFNLFPVLVMLNSVIYLFGIFIAIAEQKVKNYQFTCFGLTITNLIYKLVGIIFIYNIGSVNDDLIGLSSFIAGFMFIFIELFCPLVLFSVVSSLIIMTICFIIVGCSFCCHRYQIDDIKRFFYRDEIIIV